MKRLLVILLTFCSLMASAQQYNNEWIDYNKTYYKFMVGTTGLYRISQAALAGIGLGNTDASHFQLWRNGVETPLFTTSQSGALAAGGYIEFWGEINDGKPDNQLYRNSPDQINDNRSLFTDTASYFLTVNPAGGNKRLVPTSNTIPVGAAPEPYFMYTKITAFNEAIHFGRPEGSGLGTLYTASYEQGKGWASNDIGNGGTRSYAENNYAYVGAGAPEVSVKMNVVGNFNVTRNVQLSINGNLIFDNQLVGYDYARLNRTVAANVLTGSNDNFSIVNTSTAADRIRVAMIEMTYGRTFNFGGANNFTFQLPANSTGKYLEITGFSFTGIPVLYDLTNGRRYEVDASNPALLKVFVQPSASVHNLVLVSQDASLIKSVTQFESRTFINYALPANQGDYLMVTHKNILAASNGSQPVEEYRAYRSSAAGGGYNAKVYMIDQLIDQFAFGIKNDPLGLRNFTRFARDKFSVKPRQVFIAGKGVTYYISRWYENVYSDQIYRLNLIPTMGNPGSDVLLTSQGSSSAPLTPVGRLSIVNGDELATYLNKVKQYESALNNTSPLISESAWKKNVIHMVGANDQPTIDLLYGLLNNHKKIIQDTLFGANVTDFVKSYSSAVQQLTSERLANLINSGVGLLTYFGHSSSTSLGFNLDDPMNYNNAGKYPLFNMMGCNVGDIFGLNGARISGPDVLSEKYVLAKDRGSIGMLAGSSIGYVNTLDFYNFRLYKDLSTTHYARSIGELMQSTIIGIFNTVGEQGQLQRSQCEEYTLNGDPAIRLYQFDKPDYVIEDQLATVAPSFVSIAESNFTVNAKMMNLGKAISEKIVVELKRTYPDLSTAVIRRDTIPGIRYIDSLLYTVPIDPVKDKGLNKITITIDPANAVAELYETNNSITKEVFIFEDELRPVYPYNFAIVNKQGIKFAASTANPLATSRNYLFEIDTTELFNSPLKVTQTKTSSGGLIEFTPTVTFRDSTVYYWRVASAPSGTEQPKWNSASFIYINGPEVGFNQSHYYQFLKNSFDRLKVNQGHSFEFGELSSSIRVSSGIYPYAASSQDYRLTIADAVTQVGFLWPLGAQANSIRFYVVNNKNMQAWVNQDLGTSGRYGSYRPIPINSTVIPGFFQFDLSAPDARKLVMNFIDSIPAGHYLAFTNSQVSSTVLPSVWQSDTAAFGSGNSLYHKLKSMGFGYLDSVNSFVPYVMIGQKGNTTALKQYVAKSPAERVEVTATVQTSGNLGFMESPSFGMAKAWKQLVWEGSTLESLMTDRPTIDIIGVTAAGTQTLISTVGYDQKVFDISGINAQQYPYLKLRMRNVDSTNSTPYQLKYWRLYYTPAPEGAIAPNLYFSFKDTLGIGEPLNLGVAFKNVSDYNFGDSIKVKLTVRDQNNNVNSISVPDQKVLVAGDTIRLSVPVTSKRFTGSNSLYVEFNPDSDQPEQFHFNNFLYKNFFVRSDSLNPYLDITFDGVHILNKDIVSSKPDILIKLTDDASWMLLNSNELVKVQLKYPDGSVRDFNYNSDTLKFNPASQAENNVATVNFKPYLTEDGTYELIVAAKDQSNNPAGDMQYRVAFQVINKPMISNLLNYPNPFTTSTAFVFTLTGSEVPQNIRIQILTITGKIVKEITKNELGPIKIGRNITEYKWDGTDQFGQKLANGVYLYRVITNLAGKQLDKYTAPDDKTDKYFNKGYGKMYLMR